MREQIATHTYARSMGTTNGLHPHDELFEDDEAMLYQTRMPSSVRTYKAAPPTTAQTRTVVRVTRHDELPPPTTPRASRITIQTPESKHATEKPHQRQHKQMHWLFYVGIGMVLVLVVWIIGNGVVSWLQAEHDTLTYGSPRTFQVDQDVKHGGISHFTVENLDGHIIIIETQVNDLSKTKIYAGPVFSGAGADTLVATVSFRHMSASGLPDMLLTAGNEHYILINTGSTFRPPTPADHLTGDRGKSVGNSALREVRQTL